MIQQCKNLLEKNMLQTKKIEYRDDDTLLEAFCVYDDNGNKKKQQRKFSYIHF